MSPSSVPLPSEPPPTWAKAAAAKKKENEDVTMMSVTNPTPEQQQLQQQAQQYYQQQQLYYQQQVGSFAVSKVWLNLNNLGFSKVFQDTKIIFVTNDYKVRSDSVMFFSIHKALWEL